MFAYSVSPEILSQSGDSPLARFDGFSPSGDLNCSVYLKGEEGKLLL